MNRPRYGYAVHMAGVVLRELRITHFPLNIEEIARKLNIGLLPFGRGMLQGFDAFIFRRPSDKRVFVAYNTEKPFSRIRFTLAHEIGHFVLGHIDQRPQEETLHPFDIEADVFARNLLAPARLTKLIIKRDKTDPVPLIARTFGLSVPAARVRLDFLDRDLYYAQKYRSIKSAG